MNNDVKEKFNSIDNALEKLEENNTFDNGLEVVKSVINLLGIKEGKDELVSFKKLKDNPNWTVNAHGYEDRKASYVLAGDNDKNIDFKFFWTTRPSKRLISNIIALTPNFEDEEFYSNKNIGIDFILPEEANRVIIVLSKNYKIRTLEISQELSNTQKEIFTKWHQDFDFSNKAQVHQVLWDSFDIFPINKEFYEEISSFFIELVQHLEKNKILDKKHCSQFTNRLIGRLIFCWFLRKKDFIQEDEKFFDPEGKDSTKYYRKKLEPLFFEILNTPIEERVYIKAYQTPFLNGGLFEPREHDFYEEDKIIFPRDYFQRFYSFLNRYNFTTDESTADFQQVAIDPEMLGRIFENLLAEEVKETGEQARKDKGAFYTPREIVDYMCKESLKNYLLEKFNEEKEKEIIVNLLFDKKEHDFDQDDKTKIKPYKNKIIDALDEVKIIDPACGSGAFPIGMMQLILAIYERLESRLDHYKTKLKIIEKNIYGVDIEPMAAEISRLRTWLSLVVDDELIPNENNLGVDPLPNLEFKFVCANSLIPLDDSGKMSFGDNPALEEKIQNVRDRYFKTNSEKIKIKMKKDFEELINKKDTLFEKSKKQKQLLTYHPFNSENITQFFNPKFMFGIKEGFDIVVGNPPYVSTKGVNGNDKKTLKEAFGFFDDLYSHFYFKGLEITKSNTGILAYITSKTFWTIQTKKNVRGLLQKYRIIEIFDTAAPFAAMVDTCVVIIKKDQPNDDYLLRFNDGKKNLLNPQKYTTNISLYKKAVNQVFFIPSNFNLQIYKKYNQTVKSLMQKWWPRIETSKKISQNENEFKKYRETLKPGDVALLGTLTEGGQGLATGNNGKYVGVRDGTKKAEAVRVSRPKKLVKANKKIKNPSFNDKAFLANKAEAEIRDLFDGLKEKYGRDIFGQGYIFRIVSYNEIADVDQMTGEEKKNGIDNTKSNFVSYDKGDKDGNRWWLKTPFVIDWSKESVGMLQKDPKARWQGYNFYFREGFCWSDIHTVLIKSRLKSNGVYDVKSMSMFSQISDLPDWFFVSILNSTFISYYDFNFINNTQTFQINDARQIPIIVPSKEQLEHFKSIFDEAYSVKKKQFSSIMSEEEAKDKLNDIQKKLDKLVYKLYGLPK